MAKLSNPADQLVVFANACRGFVMGEETEPFTDTACDLVVASD
jgi:hypothetical protein